MGKRVTGRGRGNYETRKTNVEQKEVKDNQNTKQEKEKSKNDASLDRSDPSHSMLQAVHLETHRQCRKNPARDISKRSNPDRDQDRR
jgi:hypothetical protein